MFFRSRLAGYTTQAFRCRGCRSIGFEQKKRANAPDKRHVYRRHLPGFLYVKAVKVSGFFRWELARFFSHLSAWQLLFVSAFYTVTLINLFNVLSCFFMRSLIRNKLICLNHY